MFASSRYSAYLCTRQNYMSGTKEEAAAMSGYFCALSRKGGA